MSQPVVVMATCEHPDIDATSFDDRLSSISDGAEAELHMEIANAVCDDYVPSDPLDDTSDVLKVFLQRLYGPGLYSLAVEIFLYKNSPNKLRALRNHLIDALLNPSECEKYFKQFYLLINYQC